MRTPFSVRSRSPAGPLAALVLALVSCGYRGPIGGYYFDSSHPVIDKNVPCRVSCSVADGTLAKSLVVAASAGLSKRGFSVVKEAVPGEANPLSLALVDQPLGDPRFPYADNKSLPPDRNLHVVLRAADGTALWSGYLYGARYNDTEWASFVTRHLREGLAQL